MKEIEITRKTAEIVLRTIDEAESANLKSDIIKMGHFNGNIFNKEQMFNHNAVTLGRFLINVAAYIGEKRFKKMMEEIQNKYSYWLRWYIGIQTNLTDINNDWK